MQGFIAPNHQSNILFEERESWIDGGYSLGEAVDSANRNRRFNGRSKNRPCHDHLHVALGLTLRLASDKLIPFCHPYNNNDHSEAIVINWEYPFMSAIRNGRTPIKLEGIQSGFYDRYKKSFEYRLRYMRASLYSAWADIQASTTRKSLFQAKFDSSRDHNDQFFSAIDLPEAGEISKWGEAFPAFTPLDRRIIDHINCAAMPALNIMADAVNKTITKSGKLTKNTLEKALDCIEVSKLDSAIAAEIQLPILAEPELDAFGQ